MASTHLSTLLAQPDNIKIRARMVNRPFNFSPADSSLKCNCLWLLGVKNFHFKEYLIRCSKPKHFLWAMIESVYRHLHLFIRDLGQIHALGEILSQ